MRQQRHSRTSKPLDPAGLQSLALHYVGRYATSSGRLGQYLTRKLRERGWAGEADADVAAVVARMIELGAIDDDAFASLRRDSLLRRGWGERRIGPALAHAGVGQALAKAHSEIGADEAHAAALAFARRKRLGPFAVGDIDDKARHKAFAAMVRAGHDFALVRTVLSAEAELNHD